MYTLFFENRFSSWYLCAGGGGGQKLREGNMTINFPSFLVCLDIIVEFVKKQILYEEL